MLYCTTTFCHITVYRVKRFTSFTMTSAKKSEIGRIGEDIACKYLRNKGFIILGRNVRQKWGEIDIVAKNIDGVIAFVEVKTLREGGDLKPEDNLTKSKLAKLKRTAMLYAGHHHDLINDQKGWRIDLVAITLEGEHGDTKISYYENICY